MTYLHNLIQLLTLSPEHLVGSLILLGALCAANDLIKTALMIEFTRSPLIHVLLNILTLFPAGLLGLVLLASAYLYRGRGWVNLGYALLLYVAWYAGGALTHLARRDTEGADPGFMTVGALVTFPVGVLAALVF
jgi:hypothetical protein